MKGKRCKIYTEYSKLTTPYKKLELARIVRNFTISHLYLWLLPIQCHHISSRPTEGISATTCSSNTSSSCSLPHREPRAQPEQDYQSTNPTERLTLGHAASSARSWAGNPVLPWNCPSSLPYKLLFLHQNCSFTSLLTLLLAGIPCHV